MERHLIGELEYEPLRRQVVGMYVIMVYDVSVERLARVLKISRGPPAGCGAPCSRGK